MMSRFSWCFEYFLFMKSSIDIMATIYTNLAMHTSTARLKQRSLAINMLPIVGHFVILYI